MTIGLHLNHDKNVLLIVSDYFTIYKECTVEIYLRKIKASIIQFVDIIYDMVIFKFIIHSPV